MNQRIVLMLTVLLVLVVPPPASGSDALARKLDPSLRAALAPEAEPVLVWVEFADKGEQGPADLAARLAAAEAALTPRARARRLRAGVAPLVDVLDLPVEPRYLEALGASGVEVTAVSRWFNRATVRTSGAALAALAELPQVARIQRAPLARRTPRPRLEESVFEYAAASPRDRLRAAGTAAVNYGQTATQMARLQVAALHDSGYDGTGVLVCVLDEGFNHHHKHSATRDLPVLATRDFVRGVVSVQDTVTAQQSNFRHGQWCLSVLGGNLPGTYVGPGHGASFMLGRTENSASETPAELTFWAMGAEWADSAGADIISSSLGYNTMDNPAQSITYSQLDGRTTVISRAAQIAASRGILVVNSAGNDGSNPSVGYKIAAPSDAHGDSVLAIAATDSNGVRASYSSKGPTFDGRIKPDLAAQGSSVLMASASGSANAYTRLSGTSFSCPQVAGLAACLMEARPWASATTIIRALKESASQSSSPDTLLGWGRVSGAGALGWFADTVDAPDPTGRPGLALSHAGGHPVRLGEGGARVRLGWSGPNAVAARARVLDAGGREVRMLWSGTLVPGETQVLEWDGRGDTGPVRPGLYFVSLESGTRRSSLRLAVLR